jgi:hypothetical protein
VVVLNFELLSITSLVNSIYLYIVDGAFVG